MRQSWLFGTTRRENPAGETSKNAILLTRGGYIDKEMAGVYTLLPLGLRVVEKIKKIIREELNTLPHTSEMLMPALQPHALWEETDRLQGIQEVMYNIVGEQVGLGPTHEEVVTDIFRRFFHSHRDVPRAAYQMQTKFRNEPRAKSGLLRGREFMMKDLYSFHSSQEDFDVYYDLVKQAYYRIFENCGLEAIYTEASGGLFSKFSHEFQVLAEDGEDLIYLNQAGDLARNKEIVPSEDDPEFLQFCEGEIIKKNSIEVANIFPLAQKYSKPMRAVVSGESGEEIEVWMGCYGIGITRLVGTVAEVHGNLEAGKIVWPNSIAPYKVHLIEIGEGIGHSVYDQLTSTEALRDEVLYDDRDISAGTKFADADLIGSTVRVVVSKRTLDQDSVEVTIGNAEPAIIKISEISARLTSL